MSMCRYIPRDAWRLWHKIFYNTGLTPVFFPKDGSWQEKLEFIDHYLYLSLLPTVDITRAHGSFIRPDLNKYRGWLLQAVLRQVLKESGRGKAGQKYPLPQSLSIVIDDLYLFHKFSKGSEANIHLYRSLDELAIYTTQFWDYRLSAEDRGRANAIYFELDALRQTKELLPPEWRIEGSHIYDDRGAKICRQYGAKLMTTLPDGAQIISVSTEEASRAYGSPRWCTAFRHKASHIGRYVTTGCPLYIILAPNGERWQIFLPTAEWRNGKNHQIYLAGLLNNHPGLTEFLTPALTPAFQHMTTYHLGDEAGRLIYDILHIPKWFPYALKAIGPLIMQLSQQTGDHGLFSVLSAAHYSERMSAEVERHIRPALTAAYRASAQHAIEAIEKMAKQVPEWHDALYNPGRIATRGEQLMLPLLPSRLTI